MTAHFQAMTKEELEQVELWSIQEIQASLPVKTEIMSLDDAKRPAPWRCSEKKYGDEVRVVSMGDFSIELCGGTHVENTGRIGLFKLVSESGIAAGVRRIEALTGNGVLAYYKNLEETLNEAARMVKATPAELLDKLQHLNAELKTLHSENESLKSRLASDSLGNVMDQVEEVNGVKLLAARVDDVDMNGLRDLGDQLKEKLGEGVVVLASVSGGKVSLLAMATQEAMNRGAHAGNLIKATAAVVGGGGGGRPGMAQAGGKKPEKVDEAIAGVRRLLEEQLN